MFFPACLSAQINESDTLNVKADLLITGSWQGGNVETLIFRAESNMSLNHIGDWFSKPIIPTFIKNLGSKRRMRIF